MSADATSADGQRWTQQPAGTQQLFAQFGADAPDAWAAYRNLKLQQQGWSPATASTTPAKNMKAATTASKKSAAGDTIQPAGTAVAPAVTGPGADVLQAWFNYLTQASDNAIKNVQATGVTPSMTWAKDPTTGQYGFQPTGELVPTFDAVSKQFDINRTVLDQVSSILAQTGRSPRFTVDPSGMMRILTDASGNPLTDETVASRQQRQLAADSVGFTPNDLLYPRRSSPLAGSADVGATPQGVTPGANAVPGAAPAATTRPSLAQSWLDKYGAGSSTESTMGTSQDETAALNAATSAAAGGAPAPQTAPGTAPAAAPETPPATQINAGDAAFADGQSFASQDADTRAQYLQQNGNDEGAAAADWAADHARDLAQANPVEQTDTLAAAAQP